jgi:F0F1-type ATP synthase epsilon subunit
MQLDGSGGGGGGKSQRVFYVEGGIAQMKDNRLTVLTQVAIPAGEIKAETARAELAEATAQRITDQKSFDDRQKRMTRARVMQQLASK